MLTSHGIRPTKYFNYNYNYGKTMTKIIPFILLTVSILSLSAHATEKVEMTKLAANGFEVKTSFMHHDGRARLVLQKEELIFICRLDSKNHSQRWLCQRSA